MLAHSPDVSTPFVTAGKPEASKLFQDVTAFVDSTGICLFATFGIGAEDIQPMLEHATGPATRRRNASRPGA